MRYYRVAAAPWHEDQVQSMKTARKWLVLAEDAGGRFASDTAPGRQAEQLRSYCTWVIGHLTHMLHERFPTSEADHD